MSLLAALSQASPIGPIPKNYPYLSELCRQAKIAYSDHTVKGKRATKNKKGEKETKQFEVQFRCWSVVLDDKPHPFKRRTTAGNMRLDYNRMKYGTSEHAKFSAILEYIEYRGEKAMQNSGISGGLDRKEILSVAIGKEPKLKLPDGSALELGIKVKQLKEMSWLEVRDECSGSGMKQYKVVKKKPEEEKEEPADPNQLPF